MTELTCHNNSRVCLYDSSNIDNLACSNSEISQIIQTYWIPMMKTGSASFIKNVNTDMYVITVDDLVLPVTVNHKKNGVITGTEISNSKLENSYVCSPYNHYITYTKAELVTLKNPILEKILAIIIDLLGKIAHRGSIDQVAIAHNLMLSTNLYPELSKVQIQAITESLKNQFPDRAIIFRSINTFINNDLLNDFKFNQYRLIGSRQIYLLNPHEKSALRTKMRWRLKQDEALIKKNGYEIIQKSQLTFNDIPRIVELYNFLYLDKYSIHNPQFTENFIELVLKNPIWQFQALKKAGRIDGVIGFYIVNGMMTTPILGYDTSLPQQLGLYRMLSVLLTIEASKKGLILHQSSGAAEFKRFRGFIGNIEYSAVYHHHLPLQRKLIWLFLELLVNQIAVPLMKKYRL
ncbi:hypothetical protein NIES4101_31510 [Calothrix sp. NIES-4101]|nr:hypothetical protein NIES4101_31510 [Calothrix sp. NIES-4101]